MNIELNTSLGSNPRPSIQSSCALYNTVYLYFTYQKQVSVFVRWKRVSHIYRQETIDSHSNTVLHRPIEGINELQVEGGRQNGQLRLVQHRSDCMVSGYVFLPWHCTHHEGLEVHWDLWNI